MHLYLLINRNAFILINLYMLTVQYSWAPCFLLYLLWRCSLSRLGRLFFVKKYFLGRFTSDHKLVSVRVSLTLHWYRLVSAFKRAAPAWFRYVCLVVAHFELLFVPSFNMVVVRRSLTTHRFECMYDFLSRRRNEGLFLCESRPSKVPIVALERRGP